MHSISRMLLHLAVAGIVPGLCTQVCGSGAAHAQSPGSVVSADAIRKLEARLGKIEERLQRIESGSFFIPRNAFERRINDLERRIVSVESAGARSGSPSDRSALGRQMTDHGRRLSALEAAVNRPAARTVPSPAAADTRSLERSVTALRREVEALRRTVADLDRRTKSPPRP